MKQNKVWILVPRIEAKDRKILSNRWIFHVKDRRYKMRIVVRGYEQKYEFDYEEIFSSVINIL